MALPVALIGIGTKLMSGLSSLLEYIMKHPKEGVILVLMVMLFFSYSNSSELKETISEQTIVLADKKAEITELGSITATKDEIIEAKSRTVKSLLEITNKTKIEISRLKELSEEQQKKILDSTQEALRLRNELDAVVSDIAFGSVVITDEQCPAQSYIDWALDTIVDGVQKQ